MNQPIDRLAQLSPEEKRKLLAELLQKKARETKTAYALSQSQRAMWFLRELAPASAAYNVAFAVRITSPVKIEHLKRVFQELLNRHPMLRAIYGLRDGQPVQEIYGYRELDFEQIDASVWSAAELERRVCEAYAQPLDLENGPLFRVQLFTRAETDHVLLITGHHIAMDGWAVWIFLDEFRHLYQGTALPPLTARYTDFVDWQTELLAKPEGERLWAYWQKQLGGELPILNLPTDRPRPPIQTFNGATREFALSDDLSQRLKELARTKQTTLYTILVTAFLILLHRYTSQEEIIIGSPMAGRTRPEFANIVGDFINMVVLRAHLAGKPTFRELLAQTRQMVLDALANQDFPLPLLVERLVTHPDPSRSPLYQVSFDLQRVQRFGELTALLAPGHPNAQVAVGDLILEPYPLSQQNGQLDLTLQMLETRDTLYGALKYNTDLFDAATIEHMQTHWQVLLASIVANPDQAIAHLPILAEVERRQLLVEWNDTRVEHPADLCLPQLFQTQVERTPDAPAVIYENSALTYRELNARANQLARYLRALGVGPDGLVGISVERSIEMLIGLLGILKAGGAYVPLDPAFPKERLAFMAQDAQCSVLLTQESLRADLPAYTARTVCLDTDWQTIARESDAEIVNVCAPDNLAYVLYTSGSTGKPKGVQITHRALANFLLSMQREPGLNAGDVFLAITTLSFDIAGLELYLPLITGARVVIASRQAATDAAQLIELLAASGATAMQATPATWRMLIDAGWSGKSDLKMLCGGEALARELAGALLERGGALWNMYGPTETTVWSSLCQVQAEDAWISLGHPIANTQFYVVDAQRQLVPIGVAGELWIGGTGLARGYLNRPELTAEKFVADPFASPSARLYRTGDLVRYHRDGRIEFLGRFDHQVKIRGFRIELGEIETVLRQHSEIQQAIVMPREDVPGDKRLVAYLVAQADLSTADLRAYLRERLPDYMLPAAFVFLKAMPLTPNGKVDRRALPAPERTHAEDETFAAPRTPMEILIAQVWQEVLRVDRVSVFDNFFDLGGSSLLSVQVLARLQKQTGVKMNPGLIRLQTLGQLAAAFDEILEHGALTTANKPADGVTQKIFRALKGAWGTRTA